MSSGRSPPEVLGFSGCWGSELALLPQGENPKRGGCGMQTQLREPGNVAEGGGEATRIQTGASRKGSVMTPSAPRVL